LLVKTDYRIDGRFPVIVIRIFPVPVRKFRHPRGRIPIVAADNIAQFSLGPDIFLPKCSPMRYIQQALSQGRKGFVDDKAVTDENLGERAAVARRRAIAKPAFGDAEKSVTVYK
jgi:hypothetical protein